MQEPPGPFAALPLVMLAGMVDAIGWLRLQHRFLSFMSGNTTMLGVALAEAAWTTAAELLAIVLLFVLGATLGGMLGQLAGQWRRAAVLASCTALLGAAMAVPEQAALLLLVPAMGSLNAALPQVSGITFVTGALARGGLALAAALCGQGGWRAAGLSLASWAALCLGAVIGAALELQAGRSAVIAAAGYAGMLTVLAVARRLVSSDRGPA